MEVCRRVDLGWGVDQTGSFFNVKNSRYMYKVFFNEFLVHYRSLRIESFPFISCLVSIKIKAYNDTVYKRLKNNINLSLDNAKCKVRSIDFIMILLNV